MRNGQHTTQRFRRMLSCKNTTKFIEKEIYFIVGKKVEHMLTTQ